MTDIRVLDDSQSRAAHGLFRGTLHFQPAADDLWKHIEPSYEPGRTFGAFDGDEMVGTVQSFTSSLAVPGGAVLPMAAVSRVGVRADWTRRGVLSALKRAQFDGMSEPVATLRASEGLIYGRFGYGVATRGRTIRIDRRRALPHGPSTGRVRIVDSDTAGKLVPELFEQAALVRPGTIGRWPGWWEMNLRSPLASADKSIFAVHSGPDGDDGYVMYQVQQEQQTSVLTVHDLWAANEFAWADLWRFVLRVDLVDEITAELRPLDEPVEWLLADARACTTTKVTDETWLRLLDVPVALAARSYGPGAPVVLEVVDRFLPANSGTYRVTPDGVQRSAEPAQITLDVDALATVYLGDTRFSQLAAAGRLTVSDPAAVADADTLFAAPESPWSGTFF